MARKPRSSADSAGAPPRRLDRKGLQEVLGLFRYILPYRGKFGLGLVFLAASSLTTLAFPYVIGDLVDAALAGTKGPGTSLEQIHSRARMLILILVVQAIFSFFRILLFVEVGEKAMAQVRQELFGHLLRLPMSFFSRSRVGELTSRIASDISLIQDTLVTTTAEVLRGFSHILIGIGLLVFISPELTLVMLASFPVVILVAIVFGRYIRKLARQGQDKLAEAGIVVEESLQGIQNVKAFTNEPFEQHRYSSALQQVVRMAMRAAWFRGGFASFVIFALFGSIVLVIWYGSVLVQQQQLTIGSLTTFLMYTLFVGGAIGGMGEMVTQLLKAAGATERVRELLREAPEEEATLPTNLPEAVRFRGSVRFEQVSFRYPSRPDIPVLVEVTFAVEPGQKIALVGPSGAGKSTLIGLLQRFYSPTEGRIWVDDFIIEKLPLAQLRGQMAIVPQEVLLFGGTIRENISYGKHTASEAEIVRAAQLANAWSFITQFPERLETRVGDRGIQLSGGQRQRIAIARAILRDPAILLLDEATSSLDAESERQVQEALEVLMQGRTTFIVAHRLATVRQADTILVLDKGRIVETGNHEELMQQPGGIYRNLANLQFLELASSSAERVL